MISPRAIMQRRISSKSCLKVDTNNSMTLKKSSSRVSFHEIEIAEYPVQVGDNPSAEGVPVSIGWECDSKQSYDFNEYETAKPHPRSKCELLMPPQMRRDLLERQGVTASEMLNIVNEMKEIKRSRNKSIRSQKWDKLHLAVENSKRKLKKVRSMSVLSSYNVSICIPKTKSVHSFDDAYNENPLDHSSHISFSLEEALLLTHGPPKGEDEKVATSLSSNSEDYYEEPLSF